MTSRAAFIAANRLGFGARPGDLARIAVDPKGWAAGQLDAKYIKNPHMDAVSDVLRQPEVDENFSRRAQAGEIDYTGPEMKALWKKILDETLQHYIVNVTHRLRACAETDAPLFERLVQFWSNHFTVSTVKFADMPLVVGFERDAIRPHVLGKFSAMLRASTRHPAMLFYLDNIESIGPNSPARERLGRGGLNENLAREILELHTLGVNGGYTQADVTEFSKILTGWNVTAEVAEGGLRMLFIYHGQQHEPGLKTVMGKEYKEGGEKEALAALDDFAAHPATARHIATKLARHFISDDPPQDSVEALAAVFTSSGGDLMAVYKVLLGQDALWAEPLPKLKTPNDFITSILRATGFDPADERLLPAARVLGQMPFTASSPAGWGDTARDWMSSEALLQRLGLAQAVANTVYARLDPARAMEDTIGPVASEKTRAAILAAGSRVEALTLLLASPEFQRR